MTQLHFFCQKGMTSSVMGMLEIKSIDVEARQGGEEDGWTCLMIASSNGHFDICRLLIDQGAQVKAKDIGGGTPLHFAARFGRIEIVRLFCDYDTDIEECNDYGWRPLHYASEYGHISIVKELIEVRNADINARNEDRRTALWFSRDNSHADIAAYLVSHGGII